VQDADIALKRLKELIMGLDKLDWDWIEINVYFESMSDI
jgi:hypothetical protein